MPPCASQENIFGKVSELTYSEEAVLGTCHELSAQEVPGQSPKGLLDLQLIELGVFEGKTHLLLLQH